MAKEQQVEQVDMPVTRSIATADNASHRYDRLGFFSDFEHPAR